jgi:hypothetical protein
MGLAVLAVLAISVEEVSAPIYRRRAERLLQDLRQLQVGKSSFEDARAVIMRHGGGVSPLDHSGCSPAHCTFDVGLEHYPFFIKVWGRFLNIEALFHVLRAFPPLGLQDWDCGGHVEVDAGHVTYVSYGVFVRGSGGSVLGRNTQEFKEFKAIPMYLQERMGQRSYHADWFNITTVGGGEGIRSIFTPQANAEERKRASDFDFDCLTRLGGCTSLCQSAPSALADLLKETGQMWRLDEHDPNCAKFKQPAANPNQAAHP